MKNLAKKIAVAISFLAVLFSGCSNDVGGSISNTTLLTLLQLQKNSASPKTISKLNVVATSSDEIVQFGKNSRTILPSALQASDLTFYLWGEDVINGSVPNQTAELYRPKAVEFAANDSKSGTVSVDLAISNYKMYLAAVITADSKTEVDTKIADGSAADSAVISTVLAKSVLYAKADVDLRYNETVKFYLSPTNLEGSGTVSLNLRTFQADTQYWNDPSYAYTICIKDEQGNIIDDVSSNTTAFTVADKDASGDYKWNDNTNGIDKTYVKYTKVVKSGVYNLFVYFHDNDTLATSKKIWLFVDKLIVLPGQKTTKSTTHSFYGLDSSGNVTNTPADITEWLIDIPNRIAQPPACPENLRVGYNNLMSDDSGYYLATFEWDVKDDNAEYYALQLMDVSSLTDDTLSGLKADALGKLAEFNTTYVDANGDLTTTNTDKRLDEKGTRKVPLAWQNLASYLPADTGIEQFDQTISNQSDFKLDVSYAGGGLHTQSSHVALWLPLGHVFVARIASVNDACSALSFDISNATQPGTSSVPWVYVTEKSLTETDLENISTKVNSASGSPAGVYSPVKWSDNTSIDGDEPLAINRYQVKYYLDGGSFHSVDSKGILANPDVDVTASTPLIDSSYDYIRVYGNITTNGFGILDPKIYNYKTGLYSSLFKNGFSWTAWLLDGSDGSKFAYVDWRNDGKILKVDANGLPVDNTGTARVYDSSSFEYVDADDTVGNDDDWFVQSRSQGKVNVAGITSPVFTSSTGKLAGYKQYSANRIVYTNKRLAVYGTATATTDTYKSFGNLKLFAYYTAEDAAISIYQAADYEPQQRNVRIFKTPGVLTSFNGQLQTGGAGTQSEPVDASGLTDGEVMPGTIEIDLTAYKTLTFILVEDELAAANKDKWDKATLVIKQGNKTVYNKEMKRGTFTPGQTPIGTVGSNSGADPLSAGAHNDFYFKVATTSMSAGIYQVTFNAFFSAQPDTPLTRTVTYKLIEG